jgi:hypothetical protein
MRAAFFVLCIAGLTVGLAAAEKAWQTGTCREMKVERPKVVFGVATRDPNSAVPRSSPQAALEKRIYVIETDSTRYELRQDATVDTPRIDVLVGEPVTFAIDKNDIWIKDSDGREHKMKITRRGEKSKK